VEHVSPAERANVDAFEETTRSHLLQIPLRLFESASWHTLWSQELNQYTLGGTTHTRPLYGNEKVIVYCTSKLTLYWLEALLRKWLCKYGISYAVACSNQEMNFGYATSDQIKEKQKMSNSWSMYKAEEDPDKCGKLIRWEQRGKVGVDMAHDSYQYSMYTRILLTTYEVSSYAKTFNDGRNQIQYDKNPNTGQSIQSEHRSYRLGQTRNVYIYTLETLDSMTAPSFEYVFLRKCHEKEKLIMNTIEAGSVALKTGSKQGGEWSNEEWNGVLDQMKWIHSA
jgi:hypothetical protein